MGVRDACGLRHWDLRWSSLWGHETSEGCAEMGVEDACGRWHLGLRWSSLWGHETCEGCAEMGVRGVPKWVWCAEMSLWVWVCHWGLRWSCLSGTKLSRTLSSALW